MRASDRWNYIRRSVELTRDILFRGRYDFTYDLMPSHQSHMPVKKRINLIRAGANLLYRRTHPWSWPLHIHIELTNYCNLKCIVCPTGIGKLERKPASIDPTMFRQLMDEIGPYLLTISLWGWGEPLLHPQLPDILHIAQDRGATIFLSTNGQSLDNESVLQALVEYPPTYLIVCLDGITDETNSVFRVGAKLAPALGGVQRLAQMKEQRKSRLPVLHLRYIVMKHNEHELPYIRDFAEANEFDELTIRTLSIIDAPEDMHRQLIPDTEEFRAYSYADGNRIKRTDWICEKAFTFPAVFADGTVVSCDQDCNAQQPYGSLADGSSFASLWWSKRAAEIRSMIRNHPEYLSFCNNCPFKDRPVKDCSIHYYRLR
jgi:radical SAM protein with 4Fe4S-binding SPASM domain